MTSRITDGIKSILKRKQSSVQEDDDPSIQDYLKRSRRGKESSIGEPRIEPLPSVFLDREKHETYNNLLQSVYEEDNKRKEQDSHKERDSVETADDQPHAFDRYDFLELFRHFAIEHENILQVLIVLPLLLMFLYIVLIEETPVYRYVEKSS